MSVRDTWCPGFESVTFKPILVIEDHPVNLELILNLLEVYDYQAVHAVTALAGIELARSVAPALILMDLSLPGVNGFEAIRKLKADAQTTGIPIIAVTAHALATHRKAALDLGCCAFVTKPIDPRGLMLEIKRILEIDTTPATT
jgi:two-component system cell cycle response regulator DivK